jgi:hypothetical protein
MGADISPSTDELQAAVNELMERAAAIRKREEISEASFRVWLSEKVQEIARRLSIAINVVYETLLDVGYSWKKGWEDGKAEARRNSIRYRNGHG